VGQKIQLKANKGKKGFH